jgi:hypothetical protein
MPLMPLLWSSISVVGGSSGSSTVGPAGLVKIKEELHVAATLHRAKKRPSRFHHLGRAAHGPPWCGRRVQYQPQGGRLQ